jgi:putative acetyltransferase
MIDLIRTDSGNKDFVDLVSLLDKDLKIRDGDEHAFFAQYNKLNDIRNVIVAYHNGFPVGCGAFKIYANETGEVKRMFVRPEFRRQGIAGMILSEIETWANELKFHSLILETGRAQPEAISLYRRSGYEIIPNYGQYENVESSVCMKKEIINKGECIN